MYLNLVQIAESFGVSESVVEGWIRNENLPHTPDRGRLLFDRAQVAQWAATRGLASQAGFLAPEPVSVAKGWQIEPLLRAGGIWRDVGVAELPDVIDRVVAALPGATPPVRQLLSQRLRASKGVTFAPVGGGFALPHPAARVALGRDAGTVALIFLREPLVFPEPKVDETPVTRLLFFIAPSPRAHLELLGRLSRLLSRVAVRELLAGRPSDEQIFQAVAAAAVPAVSTSGTEGGA
ncbi:MAG: helix-turn-helix domain-containing protein [Verrucomicrobia bacterium]|nr:helix-turn-helix domain-containing protein [Verrucomicrobiota bacterium]